MALAIVAGSCLGAGAALGREFSTAPSTTRARCRTNSKCPCLGEIPRITAA
jgi:hypothetical protein